MMENTVTKKKSISGRLFNDDSEERLMELWCEVKLDTKGEMVTNLEKFWKVASQLNKYCSAKSMPTVSPQQVKKIDSLVA